MVYVVGYVEGEVFGLVRVVVGVLVEDDDVCVG